MSGSVAARGLRKTTMLVVTRSEARELFMRMGKQLGQRAIYFEVRETDEMIDLD